MAALSRNGREKKIAGVCSGIADYYNVDVTLVRVAFCIGVFMHGVGLLAYIILWIAMPEQRSLAWAPTSYQQAESSMPYDSSRRMNPTSSSGRRKGTLIAGIGLIVAGFYFLILNVFPWLEFENYSPVFLIIAGVLLIGYAFSGSATIADNASSQDFRGITQTASNPVSTEPSAVSTDAANASTTYYSDSTVTESAISADQSSVKTNAIGNAEHSDNSSPVNGSASDDDHESHPGALS